MAKLSPKVLRTHYQRMKQDELSIFAQNVGILTDGKSEYGVMLTELTDLSKASQAFAESLVKAFEGGRIAVETKNADRIALFAALETVSDALDKYADGQSTFITNAGFVCQKGSRSAPIDPEIPLVKTAKQTLVFGKLEVAIDKCEGARQFAYEWSDNQGESWQNGQYSSTRRALLKVTPHSEIWVRVAALGAGQRKSLYSRVLVARSL